MQKLLYVMAHPKLVAASKWTVKNQWLLYTDSSSKNSNRPVQYTSVDHCTIAQSKANLQSSVLELPQGLPAGAVSPHSAEHGPSPSPQSCNARKAQETALLVPSGTQLVMTFCNACRLPSTRSMFLES